MRILKRLWKEESAAVVTAEFILIASVLVIGLIVGLKVIRDAVISEQADVGQAVSNVDQSFAYGGTSGHRTATGGAVFNDLPDFCDVAAKNIAFQASKCVVTCDAVIHPTNLAADGR